MRLHIRIRMAVSVQADQVINSAVTLTQKLLKKR